MPGGYTVHSVVPVAHAIILVAYRVPTHVMLWVHVEETRVVQYPLVLFRKRAAETGNAETRVGTVLIEPSSQVEALLRARAPRSLDTVCSYQPPRP